MNADLLKLMENHVQKMVPEEACGMLGGLHNRAARVYPITNRLHSRTRFEMEPLEQLQAMDAIEQESLDILAIFHSHPEGPPFPSLTDLNEFAYPGVWYLIWFPEGPGWQVKGFEILDKAFAELRLVIGVSSSVNGGTSNVA